jgi:phage baseplate assembly protein W
MAELEESIRQSIYIIIGTAPGERVMRPQFGCQIHELLFAPNNANTASLAGHFVAEALKKWEPRINAVQVDAEPSGVEPNRLDLSIRYRVRASNNSRNLVYPFYLRRSDEP